MSPVAAFLIIGIIFALGDFIGTKTKAWIPSVFVVAVLFLAGYWTCLPKNLIDIPGFGMPVASIAMYMCITHMGTIISVSELIRQWKVIVITLAGLVGMIVACLLICIPLIGKQYVVSGLPPLTGGIVAALMMQEAAAKKGLELASILAIVMYVMQGFAGYPLTAICLKREGKRLLKLYNSTEENEKMKSIAEASAVIEKKAENKKLIPPIPAKYNTTATIFAKMAFSSYLAVKVAALTNNKLSPFVLCLVFGIILQELGFLDRDSLHASGSFGFLMFILMVYIFGALSKATPQMLAQIAGPLFLIIIVGVIGMAITSILVGKLLGMTKEMAFATSLTALYGFPPNYVLTEEASKALANNEEEKKYLMDNMLPQMIVGGFVTVTITSVIIAGIFTNLL
ncbi:membrane protein [Clostridium lundense]|uniref:membrane protein n=1 Tax=Clostridium lundense TaxID=319475 RepID=UPI000487B6C1|nr:membrane protein [Clostridium lundense]